jgi:trk system potassium uptake protein TrkH
VRSTARFIWLVAVANAVVGITMLAVIGVVSLGFTTGRSIFHGITIFMAAFDTGGFSPLSTSLGYYLSGFFEAATSILMVAGAMSFGLHFALWRKQKALHRNLEARTILITFAATLLFTQLGLAILGVYTSAGALGRQSYFQVLSAHTGTGFATVPSSELALWGGLAFAGMVAAMALGGMASSTAGGVKALRVGLTAKAIVAQVKRILLPEGTVISTQFWHNGPRELTNEVVQGVMTTTLLYVALYFVGAGAGLAVGLPLQDALFESISAAANVGLSVGVTGPSMPTLLKVTYLLQMWAGRLEFIAAFSLVGFLWSAVRGR